MEYKRGSWESWVAGLFLEQGMGEEEKEIDEDERLRVEHFSVESAWVGKLL